MIINQTPKYGESLHLRQLILLIILCKKGVALTQLQTLLFQLLWPPAYIAKPPGNWNNNRSRKHY